MFQNSLATSFKQDRAKIEQMSWSAPGGDILGSRPGECRQYRLQRRLSDQPDHQRNLLDLHLFIMEEYPARR